MFSENGRMLKNLETSEPDRKGGSGCNWGKLESPTLKNTVV